MGLFSKKLELERSLFETCLSMDKTEVANFRERNGFKVKIYNDSGSVIVKAELGGVFRFVTISNFFYQNGKKECKFFFAGLEKGEMIRFMDKNFPRVQSGLSDRIMDTGEKLIHDSLPSYDQALYTVIK